MADDTFGTVPVLFQVAENVGLEKRLLFLLV